MNISKFTSGFRTKLIISVYERWIKEGENIIDIGCGTGVVTKLLKDYFNSEITGCDVKNYLIYKIPFMQIVNYKIPVKSQSFDVALLNDVLHHVDKDDQEKVLLEAIRVGKKVFIFEFEPTLVGKLADIILNKFHYGDLHAPLSVRTTHDWQTLFKKLGLKSKVVKLKKPIWYPFSHIAFLVTKI